MSLLEELIAGAADLDEDAVRHLQLLLADWQILADLSFADLLLFVRLRDGGPPGYLCVGQMRPYTAQTIYIEDLVGQTFPVAARPMVGRAFAEGRVIRDTDPDWSTGVPVREEAIPVCFRGEVIAVVSREANVSTARAPSQLELTYLQCAAELAQMLADGTFPYEQSEGEGRGTVVRVGDGIVRVDAQGRASYASPNAISAYRRLGSIEQILGRELADFDPEPHDLLSGLAHGRPVECEVERDGSAVVRRLLPLLRGGEVRGGLIIVREVSDLRRHERALRIKDATIREIHHRVKNNLQTVASLLRLQGRRMETAEAREALDESVRRISSIALVHETLSEESSEGVPFGGIAQRVVDMLADGLANPDVPVELRVEGDPGELPAEVATPLALVLTELLQNCLEHAFPEELVAERGKPGRVGLHFERGASTLRVLVDDDGVGLPAGETVETMAHLGLRIARTLVESELGGSFRVRPQPDGEAGTTFELVVPMP